MTADVLAAIEGALDNWEGSTDSASWSPSPYPPLSPFHQDAVRRICAATGMDGYAAWLAFADVRDWGMAASPHGWLMRVAEPPFPGRPASVTVRIEVDVSQAVAALARMVVSVEEAIKSVTAAQETAAASMRGLAGVLRAGPMPLSIDGHAYRRRQRARRRRR